MIHCILIATLKVTNCYICDILPYDDDTEFEGAVGVDADGHQLGVSRKQLLGLTLLLPQSHRLQHPQLNALKLQVHFLTSSFKTYTQKLSLL